MPPPQAPGKKCAHMPLDRTLNPRKKAWWSPSQHTCRSIQEGLWGIQGICVLQEADMPVDAQPGPRSPGRHLPSSQARAPSPHLPHLTWRPAAMHRAPTAALCAGPHSAPGMVFTRLDRSCWSSRFLAAPSFLPPEKPGPAQGPPAPHLSDGACVCGPWSVLHGDLQVSSSSEDCTPNCMWEFFIKNKKTHNFVITF